MVIMKDAQVKHILKKFLKEADHKVPVIEIKVDLKDFVLCVTRGMN